MTRRRPWGSLLALLACPGAGAQELPPFDLDPVERAVRLNAILAADPNHVEALANLAHLMLVAGRSADALALGERLSAAAPTDPYGPYYVARAQLACGDRDAARRAFLATQRLLSVAEDAALSASVDRGLVFLDGEAVRSERIVDARRSARLFAAAAAGAWLLLALGVGFWGSRVRDPR